MKATQEQLLVWAIALLCVLFVALGLTAQLADFTVQQTVLLAISIVCALPPLGLLAIKRLKVEHEATPRPSLTDALGTLHYVIGHKTRKTAPGDALFSRMVAVVQGGVDPTELMFTQRTFHKQKIEYITGPAPLVLETASELWELGHVRPLTARDRAFFIKKQDSITLGLAYRLRGESAATLLGLVSMEDRLHGIRVAAHRADRLRVKQALVRIIHCTLASKTGQFAAVALSVIGLAAYHLAPSITFQQILLVEGALYLPIIALANDPEQAKPQRSNYRPFIFGLLAAVLSYANYVLLFARNLLSPFYIPISLDTYKQASSVATVSLLLCLLTYVFFERADHHERFFSDYLHSNKRLLTACGIALAIISLALYVPFLHPIFGTATLGFADWASAIVAAGLYTLIHLSHRHTRKHTHRAVIRLHREMHG